MLVDVEVVIRYQKDIVIGDLDAYEGVTAPDECLAKEKEYLEESGNYLIEDLSYISHEAVVTLTPVQES